VNAGDSLPENPEQSHRGEQRNARGRERESRVPQPGVMGQRPGCQEVDGDGGDTHQHGRPRAAQRIEGRRQHLHRGVSRQADGVAGERQCGLVRGVRVELSALVNQADHGAAQNHQADRGGHRQKENHTHRARDGLAETPRGCPRRRCGRWKAAWRKRWPRRTGPGAVA